MYPPYSLSNYVDTVENVSSVYANALNESLDGAACNVKTFVITPHRDDKDNHSNDTSGNDDADDDDDDVVVEEDVVENGEGVVDCDVSLDGYAPR